MRYLPVLLWIALLVYCSVDVAQSDATRVRGLPKPLWLALVVLIPFVGPAAWLLAGRPVDGHVRTTSSSRMRRTRASGPDDDPEFLAALARSNRQRERDRRQREPKDRPADEPAAPA